jgi:hypothetical protein
MRRRDFLSYRRPADPQMAMGPRDENEDFELAAEAAHISTSTTTRPRTFPSIRAWADEIT